MSAVGNVQASSTGADEDDEDYEPPGLWESFGTALRLIVGWFCVAIGVLNIIVEVDRQDGAHDLPFFLFHGMLLVGGTVLLALGWIAPRPGVVGYTVFGLITVVGTVIGAIPSTTTVCCLLEYSERHGFPFSLAGQDPGGKLHIDSQHVLADLMFFGYAGLLVLVVIAVLRGAVGEREPNGETVRPTP